MKVLSFGPIFKTLSFVHMRNSYASSITRIQCFSIIFTKLQILKLEDLEDGKSYVCSGKGETFKKLDYNAQISSRLNTPDSNNSLNASIKSTNNRLSRLFNETGSPYGVTGNGNSPKIINNEISAVRPRIVTIIRNGIKPRKVIISLLFFLPYLKNDLNFHVFVIDIPITFE